MKLDIINFKRFDKATFTFESKCILLHGPSGAGKTSILAAIAFAFTGEGKKVVRHGKTKCSVTLTLPEMTITRTKGPCRLLVKYDNVTYEDSEAQAMIQQVYPNWEFGYVSQRLYKSFVLMTPSDKLAVIENMALSGFDIELLQNRCKQIISQRKDAILKIDRERSTIETLLKDIGCHESKIHDTTLLETELESLKNEYNMKCSLLSKYTRYMYELKELEAKKTKLENDLEKIPSSYDDIDINELQSQTTKYNRYVDEKKCLKPDMPYSGMTVSELDAIIDDMKTIKSLDAEIAKYTSCERDLEKLNQFKQSHIVNIGKCPQCSTLLGSWNGTLLSSNDVVDRQPTTIEESERCEQRRMKLMASIETRNELKQQHTALMNRYKDSNNESKKHLSTCLHTVQDVDKHLRYCQSVKNNDRIWEKCQTFECEKPANDIVTIMYMKNKYNNVKDELHATTQKYHDLINNHAININFEHENTNAMRIHTKIKEIETDIKNAEIFKQWDKVKELRSKQEYEETRLPIAIRLQSLIKSAEQIVLNDTLNNINMRAANYLQRFFKTDITALLVFEGQKIDIKFTLDGCETDVNSLSGGEFARVVLAFAIAMAEMNDIHTLMLDESFASLDADTTENVLETIKDNYNGNIIIIAHQTTTGVFDQIILV
jgi:DNA repair exonuclease SbcCD ATPase subunit